jgi:hypothetical protein
MRHGTGNVDIGFDVLNDTIKVDFKHVEVLPVRKQRETV